MSEHTRFLGRAMRAIRSTYIAELSPGERSCLDQEISGTLAFAIRLLRGEAQGHGGAREQERNTHLPQSDTVARVIRRLNRERPDLAERVVSGELSANKAAIEAGFRRPKITVPTDPDRLAIALRKHLDPAALDRLRELLG